MVFVPGMDLSLKVPVLGEVCLLNAVWLPFAITALHFALRLKLRPLAAVSLVTALRPVRLDRGTRGGDLLRRCG